MALSLKSILLGTVLTAVAVPAFAQSQGDWHLGLGVTGVLPKSDNGTLAVGDIDIKNGYGVSLTGEYFVADNVGLELLVATPFKHDYDIDGQSFGDFRLLPPTLSVNYHFDTGSAWKPYLGIGATYAYIYDEDPSDVKVDNAWGLGVQAGIDYAVSPAGAIRLNARYIDLTTDVKAGGVNIGEAQVDPFVVTAAYVFKF